MDRLALREFIWTYIEPDPMLEHYTELRDISEVAVAGLPVGANFVNSLSKNIFQKAHKIKAAKKLLPAGLEKAKVFNKIKQLNIQDTLKGLR